MELLKKLTRLVHQHREFRSAYAELNGCSQRELVELGIARGDIARVAYEEAERRMAAAGIGGQTSATPWRVAALASGQ